MTEVKKGMVREDGNGTFWVVVQLRPFKVKIYSPEGVFVKNMTKEEFLNFGRPSTVRHWEIYSYINNNQ